MRYQIITVNEYYSNEFVISREAKLYENGALEYLPEPEYKEDEEETECTTTS